MEVTEWLFLSGPLFPLLVADVTSRVVVEVVRNKDSVLLLAPACGSVTSISCVVGLCLLAEYLLPGRPGGGPWGGGSTTAFIMFAAGV
jgi:hypothetical protein